MRYINADALIEHLEDNLRECGNPDVDTEPITYGCSLGLKGALSYAQTLPTADVVEVVRCKDCEYYIPDADLNHNEYPNDLEADGFCDNSLRYSDEMCFCSYGKKVQSNEQV